MKFKQTQKLVQILALTPQMRQSLRILQLPLIELKAHLEREAQENPVLEYDDVSSEYSLSERLEKIIEFQHTPQDSISNFRLEELKKKRDYKESLISQSPTLQDHLLRQLRMLPLTKRKYKIGESIITSLDDNGYLNVSTKEIADSFNKGSKDENKINKKETEEVLLLIQDFNPIGVGARNLKECLLLQLKYRGKEKSLEYKIVKHYLVELVKKKIKVIARDLNVTLSEVHKAIKKISSLEPKPGSSFVPVRDGGIISPVVDVIVEKNGNKYEIIINKNGLPKLKISRYYLNLIKSKNISPQTKKYIQDKITAALGLFKSVSQREETVLRITNYLIKVQKDFFQYGDRSLLKPLTLKDVAKVVKRNESTVSRVASKKYIQTPQGIFKFDYFFSKSLKNEEGENLSLEFIKSEILNLIDEENPDKPLKDSEIAELLNKEGIKIARRTVAKYREELKIPSYHKRKKKK